MSAESLNLGITAGMSAEAHLHAGAPITTDSTPQTYHCLITGANSGLGLSLCLRFLTHFLITRPPTHHLTLIFTTRSPSKSLYTTNYILTSLRTQLPEEIRDGNYTTRFTLVPAFVDLTNFKSVYELTDLLKRDYEKLDWVFLNAGMLTTAPGGGVDYLKGIRDFLTKPIQALTMPEFKLQTQGEVVLPSTGEICRVKGTPGVDEAGGKVKVVDENDGLGFIWSANVFGHYCLVRGVLGLLCKGGVRRGERARVVWTSSLGAYRRSLTMGDLQCVRGVEVYESSKRLTDILALTWPGVMLGDAVEDAGGSQRSFVSGVDKSRLPGFYLTHPAICATNIAGQHPVVWCIMLFLFYIVRVVYGSQWHPVTAWKGNAANMFVAEEKEEVLEAKGKVKWGSGCGRWGAEMVQETEVEGVEGGEVDGEMRNVGRKCWVRMEELRREWEGRLGLGLGGVE